MGRLLAVPGLAEALRAAPAPVVAVSPIVGGAVLKGPTAAFMELAGVPCSARGVIELYGDLLAGIVADEAIERPPGAPILASVEIATRMDDAESRVRLAS